MKKINQEDIALSKAISFISKGEISKAQFILNKIITINPKNRNAIMQLGIIFSNLRKSNKALEYFLQAYNLNKEPNVCFNLGSEYFKIGNYEKSRNFLKESLYLNKRLIKSHLLLAYLYQKTEKYDKSAVYYQNALKLNPKNRMALLGFASVLSEQGHFETALYATEKYLKYDLNDIFAKKLRASLLMKLGKIDQAYNDYAIITQTDPKFTKFNDHIKEIKSEFDIEYSRTFENLKEKISTRLRRLNKNILKRKNLKLADYSPEKNGIEGSLDLKEELNNDLKDMVDLSLLHLFNGETEKAMKYLFQARKWKKDN